MKKEFALKNRTKSMKSYLTLPQRVTAWFLSAFMLLQILLPSAVLAANIIDASKITAAMQAPQFQLSTNNAFLYEKSSFENAADTSGYYSISRLHADLLASKLNVGAPTLVPIAGDITIFVPTYPVGKLVGDSYVQARYIRQQIMEQLGRHLIDAVTDGSDESRQILRLYQNAKTFASANVARIKFGDSLAATETITADMIWPERRTINGQNVLVPIVYLSDATIGKFAVNENKTEFLGGAAVFDTVTLDHSKLTLGPKTVLNTKSALVANDSIISAGGDVNLVTGGTMVLNGSTVDAAKNINIIAGNFAAKAQVIPYQDRYGSGTRLGRVTALNAAAGTISIQSTNDITFEGSTATAANGAITLNAGGNISILPVMLSYQGSSNDGTWIENNSSLNVIGSKLTSQDTMKLVAGGAITISASELTSTQGGLEFLAQQGIYVLDEQNQTQISRQKIKGRTKGTQSEFNTLAIRSVLSAGKGVLMDTDNGDITLRASKISSGTGTSVNAKNGKVHLLITKEQSQYYENMVRKGTWTIKTHTVEKNNETAVPNAIVGGFAVEATQGVDIEYTGIVDADGKPINDLDLQINAFKNVPELAWMADLRNNPKVAAVWEEVKETHINKDKTTKQLSPAAMAIVAIAIAVATGGASLSGQSFLTTAMNAGFTTLEVQAASSLLAGNSLSQTLKSMTSDESLRSLAISMVTAGVMQSTQLKMFEVAEGVPLDTISLLKQAGQAVVDSTVQAGVSVVISGGNRDDFKNALKQNLATNATNVLGNFAADKISRSSLNDVSKVITHAALGCTTAVLNAQTNKADESEACTSAATGAAISQIVVSTIDSKVREINSEDSDITGSFENLKSLAKFMNEHSVDASRLLAAVAAFATGGDVNAAADAAGNTMRSNAYRFVDAYSLYVNVMGDKDYGKDDFQSHMEVHFEDLARMELTSSGRYTPQQVTEVIATMKESGMFAQSAVVADIYWDSGKNLEAASRKKAKLDTPESLVPTPYEGAVEEILVTGIKNPSFTQAVLDLGDKTDRVLKSIEPWKKEAIGLGFSVLTGGPIKAFISYSASQAVGSLIPEDIATKLDGFNSDATALIGKGLVTVLTNDGSLIDNFQAVDSSYNNHQDAYINHTVDGLGWITQQVVGFPSKRSANSSQNSTLKIQHDKEKNERHHRLSDTTSQQKDVLDKVKKGEILLDSSQKKGNFGEMRTDVDLSDKGFKPLHQQVTDINAPLKQGIDGVFEKDGKLYIVESKYDTSTLNTLADGTRQMSKDWITDVGRLRDLNVPETAKVRIKNGEYTPVVAKVSPSGSVRYTKLKDDGYAYLGKAGRLEDF